jgi:hypothetical protein
MLGNIVIAAKHRGHHCTSLPERLLHRSRRAHGSWHDLRFDPGLVLAPELTKELVQVTDHPQCLHGLIPSSHTLMHQRH